METITEVIGWIVLVVLAVIGLSLLFTLPTYLLWNWLMPAIFNLKRITLWQALGLNLLAGLLFRSSCSHK